VRRVAGTSSRYFLPLGARDVRVATGALEVDELGAVFTVGSERASEYSFVLGDRDKLAPATPRPQDQRIPRDERPSVTQLARAWTAGARSDEDKLDAIVLHLRQDYRYSLTEVREAEDPLLDFLFSQKVGYCTYFASAMTLLARASDVPARLVTGYRVAEWSPVAGEFVVRERNAHAWVEAWIDGAWRTYDPTPARDVPQDAAQLAPLSTLLSDAMQRIGQEVTYATTHITPAQLVIALVALAAAWAGVRALGRRTHSTTEEEARDLAARPPAFFSSLRDALERRGLARAPSEPLDAFARRLEAAGLAEAAALIDRYAALRYGGVGDRGALEEDVARFVGR
jgi:hypothetical protein